MTRINESYSRGVDSQIRPSTLLGKFKNRALLDARFFISVENICREQGSRNPTTIKYRQMVLLSPVFP